MSEPILAAAPAAAPLSPWRLSVAPMLDWTDRHCRHFHRLLTRRTRLYTEMVTTGALIHGDRDDVVPFEDMSRAGNALVAAGFDTYGHVMQGTGHGIAPDGLGVALQFLKERLPL